MYSFICVIPKILCNMNMRIANSISLQLNRCCLNYRKTSNISRTLVGNTIVDHQDVVGASPVGTAPTTPSFSS